LPKRSYRPYEHRIIIKIAITTYLVARGHPLALGDQGGGLLVDLGLGGGNLVLKK
jgi:hypothetical protein